MQHGKDAAGAARCALLMGAFSTVGDVEVLQQVQARLHQLGVAFDVAPFSRHRAAMDDAWLDLHRLNPALYSHVLVVCGPLTRRMMEKRWGLLQRFSHCTFVGVNLTMVEALDAFNPFDVLIERDSDQAVRPDLSFLQPQPRLPVVGLCLVESQREYGERQQHGRAQALLRDLIQRSGVAAIEIDTRLPAVAGAATAHGFANAAHYESAVARLDLVLTTRLHGMVLALKNAVPVIAIDAVVGGDKVSRQAQQIGWPEVFAVERVTAADLDGALQRCLAADARERARASADRARAFWEGSADPFLAAIDAPPRPERRAALASSSGWLPRLLRRRG